MDKKEAFQKLIEIIEQKSVDGRLAITIAKKEDGYYYRLEDKEDFKLIVDETKIKADLGFDSLDTYELVYGVEEELGIPIPDEIAIEIETVGDFISVIVEQSR